MMALVLGRAVDGALQRQLAASGFGDLRPADRVILQRLVDGGKTLSTLVGQLGISQQATGKACKHLVEHGYLVREEHLTDGRCCVMVLAPRGRAALAADARQREAIEDALRLRVGDAIVDAARTAMVAALSMLGDEAPLRGGRRYRALAGVRTDGSRENGARA